MQNTHARISALGAFHHLTANTGNVVMQPRSSADAETVRALIPLIKAEDGRVPSMPGWFIDFWFPLDSRHQKLSGGAAFQVADASMSTSPAVTGVACWRPDRSADAWAQATKNYGFLKPVWDMLGIWRPLPERPPQTPWLVVWFLPTFVLIPWKTQMMFGAVERCVAWALAEADLGAETPSEPETPPAEVASIPLGQLAEHVWYPGFEPGLPDLMVLRMREGLRTEGNAYRTVFVETEGDRRAVLEALGMPLRMAGGAVHFAATIDRPMVRRSTLPPGDMRVCLYEPPASDWPYVVVTVLNRNTPGLGMARERYGWDWFATEEAAHRHLAGMMAATNAAMPGSVRISVPGLSDA